MSHAGSALLAQVADRLGLTRALSLRLAVLKQRRRGHDPGRVIRDLAVMLADGGECVSDLGAVRDQEALFGQVASDSTAFRVVDRVASEPGLLERCARRTRGRASGSGSCMARPSVDDRYRRDADHQPFREGGRGRELQGRLRVLPAGRLCRPDPRGARRDAAARERGREHRCRPQDVLDLALAQIPAGCIENMEILVRADRAGATHELVDYCREADAVLVRLRPDRAVRAAILETPEDAWVPALDQDGTERENGEVAEITERVDLSAWPEGSRLIVRRERPHPGAQLSFTDHDGYRFQAILTDQPDPDIAVIECRHRQRARVEDRIRDDKDTGLAEAPVQRVHAQRGLVRDRDARARPDRLDPDPAARRRARQSRTETAALPAAARRRPARVPRPPRDSCDLQHLALGRRTGRRVPEAQSAPSRTG